MAGSLSNDSADLLSSAVEIFVVIDTELFLLASDQSLRNVRVRSLKAQYHWLCELVLLICCDKRLGQFVASEDSTEDIDEDGLDFDIIIKEFKCFSKLITFSTATDVKEVSRFSSVQLDDIHSGHGKTSSIDEASNVATDVDVVQVILLCVRFLFVVLGLVFLFSQVFLTIESVRINRDLAIGA